MLTDKDFLERFLKSVKRFSDKKRDVNNALERRSDPIRSKCTLMLRLKSATLQYVLIKQDLVGGISDGRHHAPGLKSHH